MKRIARLGPGIGFYHLGALVRMKLMSFRAIDQVHIADMLAVGLIDATVRRALSPELLARLQQVERSGD